MIPEGIPEVEQGTPHIALTVRVTTTPYAGADVEAAELNVQHADGTIAALAVTITAGATYVDLEHVTTLTSFPVAGEIVGAAALTIGGLVRETKHRPILSITPRIFPRT